MKKTKKTKIRIMDVNKNNLEYINSEIKKNKKMVVVFVAHWCHHCQELLPKWNNVLNKIKNKKSNVIILTASEEYMNQLNCDSDIRGFPTIRVLKGSKKILDYGGPREEEHLTKFLLNHIKEKLIIKSRKKKKKERKKKRKLKSRKKRKKKT